MDDAMHLLWWAAWMSGFSAGVGMSCVVALALRALSAKDETP